MASFMGVGGLFILLMADLLGLLQIMMYIGGMLVMILFMVLFSGDPGGEMMAGMGKKGQMKMSFLEMLFSRGLAHGSGQQATQHGSEMQGHDQGGGSGSHRAPESQGSATGQSQNGRHDKQHMEHGAMGMSEMSMFTPIKKQAAVLATTTAGLLVFFILSRPAWQTVSALPDQNSPAEIGKLLMGKYMIAFEGAGLLILLGIFASVLISRPSEHPDPTDRVHLKAAVAENPALVEADLLDPELPIESEKEQE